jgi:branched-chain amino acid transport system ATP-binding protein
VRYGGLTAVSDVSLTVESGTITGLIGPNGAGKTTLVDALTGFTASSGDVRFRGHSVAHLTPDRRAAAGMARTFQSLELFDDLSVEENILVSGDRHGWRDTLRDLVLPVRADSTRARRALGAMGIEELAAMLPTDLSHGQQKLVALARALASEPALIMLDEPGAGFSVSETEDLGQRLRKFAADGTSMLLIDHDMALVLGFCDYVYVLEFGKLIAQGTPEEIRADPQVISAYLGEPAAAAAAAEVDAP